MSAPTYRQLLEQAEELGRADGLLAAAFEPPGGWAAEEQCCLGRSPADFARLLWADRPGTPPSGLELNAPHWYAAGFADGLRAGAAQRARPADRVDVPRALT
jgi:hypothetical protein